MTYTPQFFGKPDKKQLNQCCHEIVLSRVALQT